MRMERSETLICGGGALELGVTIREGEMATLCVSNLLDDLEWGGICKHGVSASQSGRGCCTLQFISLR